MKTHAIEEDASIIITCSHKKGAKGIVYFNRFDKENGEPYSIVKLDEDAKNYKLEVFFEGEFKRDNSDEIK
jgi:hypothetical protein